MTTEHHRPRCLLILPTSFYGFGATVRLALEEAGMEVTLENDEFPATMLGKLMGKLGALSTLRHLTLKEFRNRYPKSKSVTYELVLIIKGRGVGVELIEFLKSISKRVVAYNFDSFRFNPSPLDWLHAVDRYCTFDVEDSRKHGLPLVHLFSALPHDTKRRPKRCDVSVLMKNHSQRLDYTDQVLSALPPETSRFVYIFESNILSFLLNALRAPRLYFKYRDCIHFHALPYKKFLEILDESRVTVDFAHPTQTGLTIRCFEARSLGVSIVTNNRHTLEHPMFDVDNAVYFPLGGNPTELLRNIQNLLNATSEPSIRTINDFLAELLRDEDRADTATFA